MDMLDKSIDFLCLNNDGGFKKGKLKLPITFYSTHGDYLPNNLVLHGPCADVWQCKHEKGDNRIHGLEEWMDFYKVRPFTVVRLVYLGGSAFRFEIFTHYAVEIYYPAVLSESLSKKSVYEVDKLCSKFRYNAFRNGVGKYSILVDQNHLVEEYAPKILSNEAWEKLRLDRSAHSIVLGFEYHYWTISLKWHDSFVQLGSEWVEFLKSANISAGDLIVIQETKGRNRFKAAVFDSMTLFELEQFDGVHGRYANSKFLKGFNTKSLETGELEIPYVYRRRFGVNIANVLKLCFGGKHLVEVGYCASTGMMNGLLQIVNEFHIQENYILVFSCDGDSTFSVTVYDSFCFNHLRDLHGYSRLSDYIQVEHVIENDGHQEGTGNEIILISDSSADSTESDSDNSNSDNSSESNVDIAEMFEEDFEFNVLMKPSHVDQRGHGAYIPPAFWTPNRQWNKRTNVGLVVGDHAWEVEVLRFGSQARFSSGWNSFVRGNQLQAGSRLFFQYLGDYRFEVTINN